jgi:peptidoglycan/xylan/chitin deacetylase (PgdA/CDA1 family)
MRSIALILLAAFAAAGVAPAQTQWRGVPVLMYHKIDADVPSDPVGKSLTIDPATFDRQLGWLAAHHITTLTAAALVDQLKAGGKLDNAVVLTFDDGYEDAYRSALPLLRKYSMVASFYISADFTGTPHHLSWKEMREMKAAGMEIACHGSRHLDLTTIDANEKQYEIGHCAAAIKKWLGEAPSTYVYAAGKYDAATIAVLQKNGFAAALTERPGVVTSLAKPYELPRRRVDRADSLAAFGSEAVP